MSKSIIVLDIQDGSIRCTQVNYSHKKWNIVKSIAKDVTSSLSSDTIMSLFDEMCVYEPKHVVVVISGRDTSIKLLELELPNLSDHSADKIEAVVSNLIPDHIPMRLDQMYYDYQIIKSDNFGTTILVAAMKRSVMNGYINLLSSAGIYPDIITISPIALFNALALNQPEFAVSGKIGLIHLREISGDIVLVEDGILRYARSFSFLTGASKEQITREITNSFATYINSLYSADDMDEKSGIGLVHLVVDAKQLPMGLTEEDLPKIIPNSRWIIHREADKLAIGSALIDAKPISVNLTLPLIKINLHKQVYEEDQAAKKKATKTKLRHKAPMIAAITLLMAAIILGWQDFSARKKLRYAEGVIKTNEKQISDISALNKIEENIQSKAKAFDWVLNEYPMLSYRLYKIAEAIPENLRLKEIYIPEIKTKKDERMIFSLLNIVGYAHKQSQVEDFINELKNCNCFSEIRQEELSEISLNGERILEFNIRLKSDVVS